VLHVALRAAPGTVIRVDGTDVVPEVQAVLARLARFSEAVRAGTWRGHTGRPIRNVLNLGIGGSDLGPAMATRALAHYGRRDLGMRYVANVDGTDLAEAIRDLDPAETLVLVASKTFTTQETMANAEAARAWLVGALGDPAAVARHFVALSSHAEAVAAFGIPAENRFGFWDWVGGRYSLGSAIGLSTMIAIGAAAFGELLAGFRAMDGHFRDQPLSANLPALMGLVAAWNSRWLGYATQAVVPYDQYLARFPAYLQQLAMESLGKRVTLAGAPVDGDTGAVLWGEPGTNGQHSFFQLLHQGSRTVPVDLIGFCQSLNPMARHHDLLMANLFAQGEALAFGRPAEALAAEDGPERLLPHRAVPGNRPSSTLLCDRLTPFSLGALVALYEHSVFTQAVLWDINAFDQWGVELGKQLAGRIVWELEPGPEPPLTHDSSTNALIRHYRARRASGT
jgi:glucose-6-phosphate isomerase